MKARLTIKALIVGTAATIAAIAVVLTNLATIVEMGEKLWKRVSPPATDVPASYIGYSDSLLEAEAGEWFSSQDAYLVRLEFEVKFADRLLNSPPYWESLHPIKVTRIRPKSGENQKENRWDDVTYAAATTTFDKPIGLRELLRLSRESKTGMYVASNLLFENPPAPGTTYIIDANGLAEWKLLLPPFKWKDFVGRTGKVLHLARFRKTLEVSQPTWPVLVAARVVPSLAPEQLLELHIDNRSSEALVISRLEFRPLGDACAAVNVDRDSDHVRITVEPNRVCIRARGNDQSPDNCNVSSDRPALATKVEFGRDSLIVRGTVKSIPTGCSKQHDGAAMEMPMSVGIDANTLKTLRVSINWPPIDSVERNSIDDVRSPNEAYAILRRKFLEELQHGELSAFVVTSTRREMSTTVVVR